ncbi:GTPase HflX [Cereibacter sphaeroides]|uniref:GTPase HflX n=1 Tax=Cereibacter sphaeroides TaxID=1063 RepID=UPI001F2FF048|nr:GTPase HflX [Cereibacter sphaeroides]MCE6952754.1 GTPase HflX [Cereibacter sphaeroides]MCE6962147.1 GTPase HflX [Cereibacter sphaeroides]MCE6970923.1 GTPase HflX [Cereibacter sphaeroides]MCE6972122.1 GTPase HflX [Cereibacter sphaeroides]
MTDPEEGEEEPRHEGHDGSTRSQPMRAFVLHPDIRTDRSRRLPEHRLAEAVALAAALPEMEILGSEVVRLPRAQPGLLFGSGKVDELKQKFAALDVGLVLVDGPVSPVQQRNLEKEWGVKLLDRTGLILEIFADRARTREGVLQVELAALSYQRTRLVRAWTHLERQRGGFGFVGGPGETQIEADRRAIDEQVIRIKRQLEKVVKTRELHRASRRKVPFPIVALVGYTNAGKSTLFNRATGAEVLAKDMLFATLDPTMRGVTLPSGRKIILSDTVGFISDLPTQLVAAFRATLEEVLEADLILHVRDISHPETAEQAADVADILQSLGVKGAVPQFEVWNKLDLVEASAREALVAQAARSDTIFALSALTGEGLPQLLDAVSATFDEERTERVLTLGFAEGRRRAWLHDKGVVTAEEQTEDGYRISVRWTARQEKRYRDL